MIDDLSLTLRAILDDPGLTATFPELVAAQVVFDRPTDQFKPTQTTIDVFLYDIRENVELRTNEPIVERKDGQVFIRRAPMRTTCSYLVTAWPVGGTEPAIQEHRLLSQVAQVLSWTPTIPPSFLKGKMVGQEPPLPTVTLASDGLKNPAEFWSALGSRLRASLTVAVTISMDVYAPQPPAPMVAAGHLRLGQRTGPEETQLVPATVEELYRIGGRITNAAGAPVANATATIVELALTATSDPDGRFVLGIMHAGTYTLRVQSGATVRQVSVAVPPRTKTEYNVQLT